MKKKLILTFALLAAFAAQAQKFMSEQSTVVFYSKASIEDITATNKKSVCMFETGTGEIAFSIPIKEFVFAKTLMQEHFNEKYMETEKFPKSTFQGKITGYSPDAIGPQQAKAAGKLTIHGVTLDIDVPGTVEWDQGKIKLKSKFVVRLEDYKVARPKLLWSNIAEAVDVTIDFTLKPYEK